MSLITELATRVKNWANGKFAVITHNHDSAYEPKNVNIQNHIGATNNPHSVTKAQVGLGNVTNDAQVKKNVSSTNGNIPVWNGTGGDALGDGYGVDTSLSTSTTKIPTSNAVRDYIDNLDIGTGGVLLPGVADLTALKALNTTSDVDYPDKAIILVETLGVYRFDRDSSATADDDFVIQPTTGVGRWFKMSSNINAHNHLSSIQGGQAGEYYHLNLDRYNASAGTNGTPNASNKYVTASDPKLTYLEADGEFPNAALTWTAGDLTAFENALNS